MTWNAPPTAVLGAALPYTWWNTYVRDNLLETAPAKAIITANATHFTGNGTNVIAQREVKYTTNDDTGTSVSTSYGDLTGTTVGPAVTITTGGWVLIAHSCQMSNSTTGKYCAAAWDPNGSGANDNVAVVSVSATAGDQFRAGATAITTVTPGSNTFTLKYKVEAGTGSFLRRRLIVMAF